MRHVLNELRRVVNTTHAMQGFTRWQALLGGSTCIREAMTLYRIMEGFDKVVILQWPPLLKPSISKCLQCYETQTLPRRTWTLRVTTWHNISASDFMTLMFLRVDSIVPLLSSGAVYTFPPSFADLGRFLSRFCFPFFRFDTSLNIHPHEK